MSVLILVIVAVAGGLATMLVSARRRTAFAVGLLVACAALVAAARITGGDTVPLAGAVVGGTDGLRTLAMAWALSTLTFGIIEGLLGHGSEVLGPALIGLGVGAMGVSVADSGIGFSFLAAGALATAIVPLPAARARSDGTAWLGLRFVRPVLASALLSLLVVAWGASPVGPFASTDPVASADPALRSAMGVALLAIAAAVVVRTGALPAHAWVAHFAEAMPASAIPPLLGWGSAAFGVVALAWVDVTLTSTGIDLGPERAAIGIIAVGSIALGGLAAILHDDLEHVLAYAIVQDAGIALLAFASPSPDAGAAGREWLFAAAAVSAALAAWVLVARGTFGVHHLAELRGWARRSPLLGIAFLGILIGAVGLPGMGAFAARAKLIELVIPGPIAWLVTIAAFTPLIYLGRTLLYGVDAMAEPVRAAERARPRRPGGAIDGWAIGGSPIRAAMGVVRANRHPMAAAGVLLAAVVGLVAATGGLGSTTVPNDAGGGGVAPSPSGPSASAGVGE